MDRFVRASLTKEDFLIFEALDDHLFLQGHMQNSTEVGYVISKEDLNAMVYDAAKSSVRNLVKRSGLGCGELVAGELSFGGFLEREGDNAVPSPRQKYPGLLSFYEFTHPTEIPVA